VWKRDTWGEKHKNAGNGKSQCQSRENDFNNWCGATDTVIHFIPPVPIPSSQCPSMSWNDSRWRKCDFWGDPHFRASFFGHKFDFQGKGIFEVASSDDGTFQVQDFQCSWNRGRAAVAIAVAVKLGDTTVVMFNNTLHINGVIVDTAPDGLDLTGSLQNSAGVNVNSANKCSRINVDTITKHRKHPPYFFHNVKVRMTSPANTGMCGHAAPHEYVATNASLFTRGQITEMCSHCTPPGVPDICTSGISGGTAVDPGITAREACEQANPPIAYSDAETACQSTKFDGADTVEACILDYCSSDGDKELVDNEAAELRK
jgi:hypothetical protein